jgi:hypothetical protein
MKLALKGIHSPDCELGSYMSEAGDTFNVLIQATIGFVTSEGGDIFNFIACSPQWLSLSIVEKGPTWGHAFLAMNIFSVSEVENSINRIILSVDEEDWHAAATRVSQYMDWEFGSYRKYQK